MKFLLVPLIIIGMFVSFTAALLAMLFFTETIKSPKELGKILTEQEDSTSLSDEFIDPEDRLGDLIREIDEYQALYQAQVKRNETVAESLATVEARVLATKADVDQRKLYPPTDIQF